MAAPALVIDTDALRVLFGLKEGPKATSEQLVNMRASARGHQNLCLLLDLLVFQNFGCDRASVLAFVSGEEIRYKVGEVDFQTLCDEVVEQAEAPEFDDDDPRWSERRELLAFITSAKDRGLETADVVRELIVEDGVEICYEIEVEIARAREGRVWETVLTFTDFGIGEPIRPTPEWKKQVATAIYAGLSTSAKWLESDEFTQANAWIAALSGGDTCPSDDDTVPIRVDWGYLGPFPRKRKAEDEVPGHETKVARDLECHEGSLSAE